MLNMDLSIIKRSGRRLNGSIPKRHRKQWPRWSAKTSSTEEVSLTGPSPCPHSLIVRRHMCRYNSGFFFRHPLLLKYAWYWRVEPDIDFYCSMPYDPFTFMRENDKVYSFVMSLPEYIETIPTLWETTKKFCRENPQFVAPGNAMNFLVDDGKGWDGEYNRCHFWSNFEIASLDFWRGEAYMKYFETLDRAGGFYYERWGDAPVHFPFHSFSLFWRDCWV